MRKKLTQQEVQNRIDEKQDGQYKVLEEYRGKDEPLLIRCLYCGLEWKCRPNTLFRSRIGKGCKHHVNLTEQMAKKRIQTASESKITMVGKYLGAKTPTTMRCQICGYEWKTEPFVIYQMGFGCPNCSCKARKSTTEFKREVAEIVGDEYEVLGEYMTNRSKVLFRHNVCGTKFKMTPHAFLSGQRCTNPEEVKHRRNDVQIITMQRANQMLLETRNGEYEVVGNYTKATDKAVIRHNKCGKKFEAVVSPILQHHSGCPYCNASHGEDAVREYLNEHSFHFEEQYRIAECRNKRPLPFDFAVFQHNQLEFLIEYQGIQHYKPKWGKEQLEITQYRDNIKLKFCQTHGINLLRIPYKRTGSYNALKAQIYSFLNKNMSHVDPEPSSEGNSEKA